MYIMYLFITLFCLPRNELLFVINDLKADYVSMIIVNIVNRILVLKLFLLLAWEKSSVYSEFTLHFKLLGYSIIIWNKVRYHFV